MHIPAAIWVEFLNVFQYRFGGHAVAARAADQLRRGRNVRIGDEVDDAAIARVWTKHPGLTFADAAAVNEAQGLGFHLCSFEAQQQKALESET